MNNPALDESNLDAFLSAVVQSTYFNGLGQYNVNGPRALPGFTATMCGAPPATIDEALNQMGTFANCVLANLPFSAAVFNGNTGVLNVFLPPQTAPASPTSEFCASAAGEHDKFGSNVEVTVIPTNTSCNPSALAVFDTLTHEMVEAATDPVPNSPSGWKQPFWNGGREVADVCQDCGHNVAPFPFPGAGVAPYWSNSAKACVSGCGDGVCDSGETCSSCPSDCGQCPADCTTTGCPTGKVCCDCETPVTCVSAQACKTICNTGCGGKPC